MQQHYEGYRSPPSIMPLCPSVNAAAHSSSSTVPSYPAVRPLPQHPPSNASPRPPASSHFMQQPYSGHFSPYSPPTSGFSRRDGSIEYLPPHQDVRYPTTSSSQYSAPSPPPQSAQSPHPRDTYSSPSFSSFCPRPRSPLPQGTIITATADLESLVVVPLSSLPSVEAVKDVIMSRLHIADKDMPRQAFYLTQIGAGEGRLVGDEELWDAVRASGKGRGGQVTVFVKDVRPRRTRSRSGSHAEDVRSAAEYARGARRERDSTGGGSSPVEAASLHRQKSPSASSGTSVERGEAMNRQECGRSPRSPSQVMDEFGGMPSPKMKSERPGWTASTWSYSSQDFSTSSDSPARLVTSPQSGISLSPPVERSEPGPRTRSGSTTKTSPEDYFHLSPRLPPVTASSPSQLSTPHSSPTPASVYQPSLPSSPQPPQHAGSGQVVLGPSGPIRRLPPQPQELRSQTVPTVRVTSTAWAHSMSAPAPISQASAPPARPVVSPLPPRPLLPTDPRANLPQYGSHPYKNLPLPSSQSPYHNLSLQGQFSQVVHLSQPQRPVPPVNPNLPPRATTLAAPPQAQRMVSKSADNLRGTFASPPPIASPPYPGSGFRPPPGPTGHPGAAGSQPVRPSYPQLPPPHSPNMLPPPASPNPNLASAFYSAPVQAQHQAAVRASPYAAPVPPVVPPRPHVEQAQSQPVGVGTGGQRPATMYDLATGALDLRFVDAAHRRRSETSEYEVQSGSSSRRLSSEGSTTSPPRRDLPLSLQAGVRQDSIMSSTSWSSTGSVPAVQPTSPRSAGWPSPVSSAPPFQDDDGAFDGIAEADRRALRTDTTGSALSRDTSSASSARSSTTEPFTPASDAPQASASTPAKPKLVDEFGDPLDEETRTWFPVNQPALVKPAEALPAHPPPSAPPTQTTTAVPAPSSYGSSSPMRRQNSAPGSATSASGSISGGGDKRDSVPDAQDWTQTILSRFGASAAVSTENGTLVPAGETGTLRPPPPASAAPQPPKVLDEFGDELEDSSTFFPGHGPSSTPVPSSSTSTSTTLSRNSSLTNRPSLRLQIDRRTPTAASPQPAPPSQPASKPSDPTPPPSSSRQSEPPSSGRRSEGSSGGGGLGRRFQHPRFDEIVRLPNSPFARRNSFAAREQDEKDWAFRPPVETVLENLDVFFPEHDLDKPVFDLPTPAPSTPSTNASSPVREQAGPPPSANASGSRRGTAALGYRKSIRVVAQDRKRMLQKAGRNVASAASGLASNLLRRKSTKLFGARIEEVTSAQMKQISNIKEISDEDPENFSYKWIKGDLIGRGTYGHVYIALSVTTGETIAVKQVEMPRTYSDKEDQRTKGMISSLKAEIELLKDLDHPNIVLYLGMEQTPEYLSIFLEYVPGGSIGRIIRTHGKFEEDVIKFFTLQILDGLEYLHGLGILHRDMKADNILIDQDGMCKISDFGTSKKSVIHNNKQGYSAKADIWSLGCICIEMLAGSRPWEGEGFMGAMFKLGAERMRPPLPPDVNLSEYADHFVSDCLQIEPDRRPKASEAKHHPFLATLDTNWSFTQSLLYQIMAAEEERRRAPNTPSTS
ncbi:mitogen-activated protein kinase kinase kinase [Rhodotorula toruloides]|uniref:Mitogen-activated protein kinase kinase kinase n=1 Tax=Rhodotorula toruloides TaxID=5286 RepID=A0A511KHL8_RHOTO|nr:mitogen-activated protein kinase kinase kinase [Rhodotorula toruloides]